MSRDYFAFRQFSVRQECCAMKVSSDAVIFGAWVAHAAGIRRRILDIGAGTGLLSLMLAQHNAAAHVDALEIDPAAACQAGENIADSIFADRIRIINQDALQFVPRVRYDLIVSNPPFFSNGLHGPDVRRNTARHVAALNLPSLFDIVARALADDGAFGLLMPLSAAAEIFATAERSGFHHHCKLTIQDNPRSPARRGCWLFRRNPQPEPEHRLMMIRDESGFSSAYVSLVRDYYLFLP